MQTTAPSLEQGTHVLEAAGAVPTPVPPIGAAALEGTAGAAALEGAAGAAAVFVATSVVKDVGAAAAEDAPGANTPPGLEVTAGVETALVAAGELAAAEEAAPPVAAAPPAEPRVPAPAPILVIEAQFPLREVPISAASRVSTESPGFGNW